MPADTASFSLGAWTGGLNLDADPFKAQANELIGGTNFDIDVHGTVSRRRAVVTRVPRPDSDVRFDSYITWSGTPVIRARGGALYTVEDGEAVLVEDYSSGDTYGTGWAVIDGYLFQTSLYDDRLHFDGETWGDYIGGFTVPETTIDDVIDEGGDLSVHHGMPRARVLLSAHNRLFAMNVIDDDNEHRPYRVYFSGYEADPAFSPHLWPASQWFDVGPHDGQEITGAVNVGYESIIIFKERSLWQLHGTFSAEFRLSQIDPVVGCVAPKTIAASEGKVFWWDPRSGVRMFDGAVIHSIDDKIRNHLRRTVVEAEHGNDVRSACGIIYNNQYWLSVPEGVGLPWPSTTYIYNLRTGTWSRHAYGVNAFRVDGGRLYGVRNDGVVELDAAGQDTHEGLTEDFYIDTAYIMPEELGGQLRLRRVDLAVSPGDYEVDVELYSGWDTSPSKEYTLDVDGTGGHLVKAGWGVYEDAFRFRIGTDDKQVRQIRHLNLQFSSRPRRRGER